MLDDGVRELEAAQLASGIEERSVNVVQDEARPEVGMRE